MRSGAGSGSFEGRHHRHKSRRPDPQGKVGSDQGQVKMGRTMQRLPLLLLSLTASLTAADLAGSWRFYFINFGEEMSPSRLEIKVEGEKLTGNLNEIKIEGT